MDPNSTTTDNPARGAVMGCLIAAAAWPALLAFGALIWRTVAR